MRPMYETPGDLANEKKVAEVVESSWKCTCKKLPLRYELDYAIYQEDLLKGYLEIKCRDVLSTTYSTFILSAAKVAMAMRLAEAAGVPAIVVVAYRDCSKWFQLGQIPCYYAHGGRSDRNDEDDQEPVAHFPVAEMKNL